ncbi:sulfopyruvate decarboxylase subunit beta [Natrinema sp. CBA1119]|uniref:thiamine pyrophosphate-dependent enzyme n=1 Tax=Natrinema sp. CBA1119 TaxID=1608465 RepID=UPI000BF69DA9|nr:thiamine pyrophosphate-dependent enzyme [Natrinema sp. CBA1119]PGF13923.1 sulfopyruvate decarboxylase subunit beta [Natrinema sp. CBA1119]
MSDRAETEYPTQYDCTEVITETIPDDGVIVSNLGVSSWTLSAVDDRDRNYYMKGAMGTTTSVGLGLALSRDEQVTVLDGDGSLLMSLGSLTTVSRQDPSNLVIVVMDNSEFATTGGQPSLADETDLADVAEDCGLAGYDVESLEELEAAYEAAMDHPGPALVNCRLITTELEEYPDPDYAHSFLKHRFRTALLDDGTE